MTGTADLAQAVESIGGSIVVLGDAMLDEYVWGTASRISPEAPVPVVLERTRSALSGGAANAAANIAALGGEPSLVSVVGRDARGDQLHRLIAEAGVKPSLTATASRPTTCKTRVMAGSHQIARVDHEETGDVDEETGEALLAAVRGGLPSAAGLLISDYGKGVLTETIAQGAIEEANRVGIPSVVDPKGNDFSRYRGATVITPNEGEAAQASGAGTGLEGDIEILREALPGTHILVTLGARGMSLFMADGERVDVAALSRRVFDVTGAGDTVAATLVAALAGGVELPVAVALANKAAALVVEEVGIATVSRAELRSYVALDSASRP